MKKALFNLSRVLYAKTGFLKIYFDKNGGYNIWEELDQEGLFMGNQKKS